MEKGKSAQALQMAEERIDWILSHPDSSGWLKNTLRTARDRNPIDVLNDLEIANTLIKSRTYALVDRLLDPLDVNAGFDQSLDNAGSEQACPGPKSASGSA